MTRMSPVRLLALVFLMASAALFTLTSCSQSSSSDSDDTTTTTTPGTNPADITGTTSGTTTKTGSTVLTGTWKCLWGGIDYTYVFSDTEYSIAVSRGGDPEIVEKGTYTIDDIGFTTNKTYPESKKTLWAYTLTTEDGKSVFTYNMYYKLIKQ